MENTSVIDNFHRFSQLQTSVYFADFPSKHTEKKKAAHGTSALARASNIYHKNP